MELVIPETTEYIRTPYSFFRAGGSRALIAVRSMIFTFSSKEKTCNMSFAGFAKKLRLSVSSVARAIATLKDKQAIKQQKGRFSCASYQIDEYPEKTPPTVRTDLYLFRTVFEIKGEPARLLTRSEIAVLALIAEHCNHKGAFVSSCRAMGRILNFSKTTIERALDVLKRADLIHVAEGDRGRNGHARTTYHLNKKLLRKVKRQDKKAEKTQQKTFTTPEIEAANARADREHYYAALDQSERDRIDRYIKVLESDRAYKSAADNFRVSEMQLAKLELAGDQSGVRRLTAERTSWQKTMSERMAAFGIEPGQLKRRIRCSACSDTGTLPNGRLCDCWRRSDQ